MKRVVFTIFLFSFIFTQEVFSGYLKSTEVSFCMDDCGMYYIESEFSSDALQTQVPVFLNDTIIPEMYLNRFVQVAVSDQEINCIECSAFEVLEINLSNDCESHVNCFADPCSVAEECQLNTPVDCISNYCGGCYADFYDSDNNLVNCYSDDPGPNPCSDFGQEDCEWFDECVWTDNGCQNATWEDDCNGLSQDECSENGDCEWISGSDNPNNWGMCVEADNEDGPPECLLDCEGIEYVDPSEDPYEACDWIISNLSFDAAFGCAQDCDEETMIEINEIVEACYNCLTDSTVDCADVFGNEDDNDWECADLNYEECLDSDECEVNLDAAGNFEGCVENHEDDWQCSDLGYEDCMWYDNCEWISDTSNLEGYCVDSGGNPDGCFSDEGEWYCIGCELFINDCQYYDCTNNGWSDLITLDNDDCNDDNWECSDIDNPYECVANQDCEWLLNPAGLGQCVESGGLEPVCEDLSGVMFGPCDMIIGIGWNGEECTWYSGCGPTDENGVDYSNAFFDSIEECEMVCSDNQQGNGALYGIVEYVWGDAIELVAGALIEIQGVNSNFLYTTQTNEEGFYVIELPQGPYMVTAHAYEDYQVHDIYIMANQDHELNFTLGEFYFPTALSGYVYDNTANGIFSPVEDAHLVISNPNQWFNVDTYTNEDGFFWVDLPATGMYNVSVSADGYLDFNDYVYVEGITDINFYLDTDNTGGDNYAALSLENVTALPGNDILMPLFLESSHAVAGVQFSVYTLGAGFPNYISGVGFNSTDDCFTASSNYVNGSFIGIIFSLEGCTYPPNESIHIADLIFESSANVPSGFELFLEFESTLVSDPNGDEINSYGEGASILFGLQGDVNADGDINVLDIVLIVNFAIYIEEPTEYQFWASDINNDGSIDILDIVQIVNSILDN